jgi:hypothetical protein
MDELRIEIWDILFRAKESKSIPEIAELTNQTIEAIQAAVDHEWFTVTEDLVSIS